MHEPYAVRFTETAQAGLNDIDDYITSDLCNPSAAMAFLDEFDRQLNEICLSPRSGRLVVNEYIKNDHVRRFLVKNYIAYYLVDEDTREIIILRIVYASMDQGHILNQMQR